MTELDSVGNLGFPRFADIIQRTCSGLFRRPIQLLRCPLLLHPRSGEQIPPLTARIARASNPGGTTAMWVSRLDGLWCDEDFADWYSCDGHPGISPAQLATVCACTGGMHHGRLQAVP